MALLSPRFKMNLSKVTIIAISWVLIGMFFSFYDYRLIHSSLSLGPSDEFSFQIHWLVNIVIGLLAGVIGGVFLVFIIGEYLRKAPLGQTLLLTGIFYIIIFIFSVAVISTLQSYLRGTPIGSLTEFNNSVAEAFREPILVPAFILWAFVTLATQFMLQVNDKFGPGILRKFLMGQYTSPKEEERIFMFLDLKSSTTIAEKIGSQRYFNLLQDFFSDITNTVISCKGEIYQYVGDEIVLSWTLSRGLEDANCLHCFFRINQTINDLSELYLKKYGLVPEYKAGLHYGSVTAGEIGIIKREIVYSGDVLNTASRIQELCNQYKVDILISKPMLDLIDHHPTFELESIGEIELRGKQEKIELTTVRFG